MRWWTTYTGPRWNPEMGYSKLFKDYVGSVRTRFKLEKTDVVGTEISSGEWIPYNVQGEEVKVILDRFEWLHYDPDDGVYFLMKLRVAKNLTTENFGWLGRLFNVGITTRFNVFFNETIKVQFDSSFPSSPPLFRILNPVYVGLSDLHNHHIYGSGTMCVMANPDDWNPSRDDIIRAVNVAVDWITWHHNKWGSNPRGW